MSYVSPYKKFIFDRYTFDVNTGVAEFYYAFDEAIQFKETIQFELPKASYSAELFDRCLSLVFMVAGTSYYKCFPTRKATFANGWISYFDAELLNAVYKNGLSQLIFENGLELDKMVHFTSEKVALPPLDYTGLGVLSMQSGGDHSLLLGKLLNDSNITYMPWHMSSNESYPKAIERLKNHPPRIVKREIDRKNLELAKQLGGLNGHVPITYITMAIALADAVLHNENIVLAAIGREEDDVRELIGDFEINHQWSKTWQAEELLMGYIASTMSGNLHVGSPLRIFSELKISELFVENCWERFGHAFSLCNIANSRPSPDGEPYWCGRCSKCANSFLLLSPFVEPEELRGLFGGKDLFTDQNLQQTFMAFFALHGQIKPFDCVGGAQELRLAYRMAQNRFAGSIGAVSFPVPEGIFDYHKLGVQQLWTTSFIPQKVFESAY